MKNILEYSQRIVETAAKLNGHSDADWRTLAGVRDVSVPWSGKLAQAYGEALYGVPEVSSLVSEHDRREQEYAFAAWYERLASGDPGPSFWADTGLVGLYHAAANVNNGYVEVAASRLKELFQESCAEAGLPLAVALAFQRTFDVALAVMQECYQRALLDGLDEMGIGERLMAQIRTVGIRKMIDVARSALPVIEWSDALSTGVRECDEQHKKLIAMVNALREEGSKGGEGVRRVLGELTEYTVSHFQFEEKLMAEHAYPEYEDHKAAHEKLVEQVGKLNEDVSAGQAVLSGQLFKFLRSWLNNHIRGTDRGYGPFLNEKGVL